MQEIRVLASFAAILVASGPMLAQSGRDGCGTVVPGGPVAGETWTAAGSPYCVTGDLFISNLTIEPGVTVLMDGPWRLNVQTTIHAEGTEQEPIVFTAADPMASKWKGMMFDQTVPGSVLRHCHFSHADDSALRVVDAPPTIDQCRFEQNTSTTNGGAINATGHVGDFWVRDSVINSNTANHHGGAIFADIESGTLHLRDSRFESNINNTPLQNGSFHGGGAHVTGNLEVLRCTFEGNVARSQTESFADRVSTGGGILVRDGDVTITQSLFVNNRADCLNNGNLTTRRARGSAVYIRANVELSNVIIGGNMLGGASEESGGGIYVESGEVTATNVTIARNERAGLHVVGGDVTVRNSILWDNNGGGDQIAGEATVEFSCVQGGFTGTGNIPFNPSFAGGGTTVCDLTILQFSPCIDAGDPDPAYNDSTACSDPPYPGERNDMGAHGGPGACWEAPRCCPSYANFNCDCDLTIFDFLAFQDAFVTGDPIADCDGNTVFTIFDFLCFQDAFAGGCP